MTTTPPAKRLRLEHAAADSYLRHCGPRAIECAEGDLLGELLAACRQLVMQLEYVAKDCHELAALDDGKAAIAKATTPNKQELTPG